MPTISIQLPLLTKKCWDLMQFMENIPGNDYLEKSMNFKGC